MEALLCVECARYERGFERGWRGVLTDDETAPEAVSILCPDCAEREFGPARPRRRADEGGDS